MGDGDHDGRWLAAGYGGLAGFFVLERWLRAPGRPSTLKASQDDQGTTRLIVAAYAAAAELPIVSRRWSFGRLPGALVPAGLLVEAAGPLGAAYARRIAAEDRLLRRELPGYAAYADATARLIPLVW